jgi:dTDP-glucose pyrophosphorylase
MLNLLVPMAGPDPYRERGAAYCKSLLDVGGQPLVQRVHENLASLRPDRLIFVVRKEDDDRFHLREVLRRLDPACIVLRAEATTAGAACTALLAIEHLDVDDEVVIANGDQLFGYDLRLVLGDFRGRGLDAGSVVFDSVHPRWSYVRVNEEGLVVEAAEKRPISRWATAGFYYFRRGQEFARAAMEMIRKGAHTNGGYYVCPAFNEMVLKRARIGIHPIPKAAYTSMALPEDGAWSGGAVNTRTNDATGTP